MWAEKKRAKRGIPLRKLYRTIDPHSHAWNFWAAHKKCGRQQKAPYQVESRVEWRMAAVEMDSSRVGRGFLCEEKPSRGLTLTRSSVNTDFGWVWAFMFCRFGQSFCKLSLNFSQARAYSLSSSFYLKFVDQLELSLEFELSSSWKHLIILELFRLVWAFTFRWNSHP